MPSRESLRTVFRQQRQALSASARQAAGERVASRLSAHPGFQESERIAVYWPVDGELDCHPVIRLIWTQAKSCYLPVLDTVTNDCLWFARYQEDTPLVKNRFGIPEPVQGSSRHVAAHELDLILAPLVAFDTRGHRLGMGGGYYDRTLAFRQQTGSGKPVLIGLAYEFQKVEQLDAAAWDIPLDGIVTEAGVYLLE